MRGNRNKGEQKKIMVCGIGIVLAVRSHGTSNDALRAGVLGVYPCVCVGPGEPNRIAHSRQGEIPSSIIVPRGTTKLLRGYLMHVGTGQFTTAERMNDRRLTPGAILCLLDVSILSALCQQFVGGRICDAWFADSRIEEKGVPFHVVLGRKVVGWYASRHQWFRSGRESRRESGGLPCGRAIDEA